MLEDYRQISELHRIDLSAVQDEDLVLLTQQSGTGFKSKTLDMQQLKNCIAASSGDTAVDGVSLKVLNGFIMLGRVKSLKVLDSRQNPYPCLGELAKMSRKDLSLKKVAYLNYAVMPKTQYDALPKKDAKCIYFTEVDKEMITVTFNYGGGSGSITTKTIEKGTAIGELPSATRSGYYFVGWFNQSTGGQIITPTTVPTGNCTYYAQWMSEVIHYVKVGSIKLEDGIASGFNTSNYLRTTDDINFGKPLTIVIRATTGSDVNSDQEVYGMTQRESNLEFGAISNRFMWEVATGGVITGSPISPNTTYWWKVVKNGNLITCYWKTDTETIWHQDKQGQRTSSINGTAVIGTDIDVPSEYWRGTIDVASSYVEMDGRKFMFQLQS